jgi:hypothetical protein
MEGIMSKALLALCLTLTSISATVAQSTGGQLAGTIADPDNVELAGATVEAANQDTHAVRRAISSTTGEFVLTDLPAGTYRLTAVLFGMKPYRSDDILLGLGEERRLDVRLEDSLSLRTLGEDPASIAAGLRRPPPPEGALPRLHGVPDLSGVWSIAFKPGAGARQAPLEALPWAADLAKERTANLAKDLPMSRCLPFGTPLLGSFLMKLVQTDSVLVMLFEGDVPGFRQVLLDGRDHPKDLNPTWQGYSVGKWEGQTLVIDTIGFNDKAWLSQFGHPRTEQLRLTERLRRDDLGHLDVEVTVDDPGAYVRPWVVEKSYELNPADEILEYKCSENNRDVHRLVGK